MTEYLEIDPAEAANGDEFLLNGAWRRARRVIHRDDRIEGGRAVAAVLATEAAPAASARVWVSYARLSKAKGDGKGGSLAIARQHDENTAYIRRVDPTAEILYLSDDGFSGFLRDVTRPAFQQTLAMIRGREVAAVVAWHADRWTRQVEVTAALVNACDTSGVELHTTLGGWHSDPTRLYIESVMAENESRQKRERQLSKHRELRAAGKFQGGRRRFGYEPDMSAIREAEATEVRDMAARVRAGESLKSVAADLNRRGVLTSMDGQWRGQTVGQTLQKRYLAGLNSDGERAGWEPILDEATHRALVRLFDSPKRRNAVPASSARKYLLSGIAECGRCGAKVAGSHRLGKYYAYVCSCGVQRLMADVDEMVAAYTVRRLTETDANGLLVSDAMNAAVAALADERDALGDRRAQLVALLEAGDLDPASFAAATKGIPVREAEIAEELADLEARQAAPITALEGATGPLAAQTWAGWTEDTTGRGQARQRAIIDLFWTVTLHPVGRGRRPFNPNSVSIVPRDLG